MYCNYAFYFGATADNSDELADLKNLEGCCGIKLFAGSSTGNLLVADEKDIEIVFDGFIPDLFQEKHGCNSRWCI